MSQKSAKALRRALRHTHLRPSELEIHTKTGVVRNGMGLRAVYLRAKQLSPARQRLLIDGVADVIAGNKV